MIVSRNQQPDYEAGYAMMLGARKRHSGHWYLTNEREGWDLVCSVQPPEEPLSLDEAQAAYEGANKAYQKSWRADDKLRVKHAAVTDLLLGAPVTEMVELLPKFAAARGFLREAEMRTKILLDLREAAYRTLVETRGE